MKKLFIFICLVVLVSFVVIAKKTTATNNTTALNANANGKLYIRSSIFHGLTLGWLYLGNDGVFVINPKHGADPINYALEKQDNAANTGHYSNASGTITARYESGKTETWKVEYLNGKLNTIDGLFSGEAPVMPTGYKISGKYSCSTFYVSVGNIRSFTFNTDGTFVLEGQGFINNGTAASNAKKASAGTYSVSGNTLKLNYNNGETSTSVIGIYNAGSSRFLVINDNYFAQQ